LKCFLKQTTTTTDVATDSKTVDLFERSGFDDCFALAGTAAPLVSTWSGRRVDFVLVGGEGELGVQRAFVLHSAASDHIPVCADLARKHKKQQ